MGKRGTIHTILYLIYGLFIAITIVLFGYLVVNFSSGGVDHSFDDHHIYDWNNSWMVSVEGESTQRIDLPANLDVEPGTVYTIEKMLPSLSRSYNCLMIESKRQDIKVYVGDQLRATYSENRLKYGHSMPMAYVFVPISDVDGGGKIRIEICTTSSYSGDISEIYLGNEMSLILMLLKKNLIWIAFVVGIYITGLICLSCFFIYRKTFEDSPLFLNLFWFASYVAVWCLSQSKVRQIWFRDLTVLEQLGYCSYLLIPFPIIHYYNWVSKLHHKVLYYIFLAFAAVNFLVQNVLCTYKGYDYAEMNFVTQLLLLTIVIVSAVFLFVDLKGEVISQILFCGFALFGLLHGIASELLCAINGKDYGISNYLMNGAVIFLLCNLLYTFINVRKEQRKKMNAESANEAKSQLLATMSHEIRTPINAVLGMNELIMRESSEEAILGYSANIEDAGKSLLSLVNDVLDFSKIESGKMDIVCVDYQMKGILNELVRMIESRIGRKDLRLQLEIDEKIPAGYYGDEVRLKQILTNLLTNAVKYTERGTITLTMKCLGIEEGIAKLYFSVKDTGQGIKEEDIEKLMDSSFVRIDEARNRNIEGTGLGLSITRLLLGLMNSKLELDSEYGVGSDFHFILEQKIVDEKEMGPLEAQTQKKARRKSNSFTAPDACILAVDDTKANLLVIKGLLRIYGCEVDVCESGYECLELCVNKRYDLILMDHMMPKMDGIETLKMLRMGRPLCDDTKVIALTANAISGADKLYQESGFDGYVTKPIDVEELDRCLKDNLPEQLIVLPQ